MKTKLKIMIPAAIAVIAIVIAVFCIRFTPADRAEDISALISTAQKYLVENNYEQAIAEFEKILELDPMNVDAYLGLAEAYRDNGNLDKAVEILEKGVELTGDGRLKAQIEELQKILNTKIPAEAMVYNGHSYYVYSDICETWEEAQEYCVSLGGYLAVINDDSENTAVYNILRSFGYKSAYFGYSDKEEDGNWIWVNDSSNYANWNEYEPSDGFYAMYYWKWAYTWNDGTFDDQTDEGGQEFICEWDIEGEGCKKIDEVDTEVTSNTETEITMTSETETEIITTAETTTNESETTITTEDTTVTETTKTKTTTESTTEVTAATTVPEVTTTTAPIITTEEVEYVTVGGYSIPNNITYLIMEPDGYFYTSNEEINVYRLKEPLTDINFISKFKNLTYLYLAGNQISDISPLSELINLTVLDLCCNQISDISPLSKLTNLTDLNLGGNLIIDASPLCELTNLTVLNLWQNQISDINSLRKLTNLTYLCLGCNQISDISPLSELINLTDLELWGNHQISKEDKEKLKQSLPNCDISY